MFVKLIEDDERLRRAYLVTPGGCWQWQLATDRDGYGQVRVGSRADGTRRQMRAHIWSFELAGHQMPEGKVLDHTCRNRACVNPEHLEPVTRKINTQRGERATATLCPKGHPYEGRNLIVVAATGRRRCRACGNAAALAHGKRTQWAAQAAYKERQNRLG